MGREFFVKAFVIVASFGQNFFSFQIIQFFIQLNFGCFSFGYDDGFSFVFLFVSFTCFQ